MKTIISIFVACFIFGLALYVTASFDKRLDAIESQLTHGSQNLCSAVFEHCSWEGIYIP